MVDSTEVSVTPRAAAMLPTPAQMHDASVRQELDRGRAAISPTSTAGWSA
jgi:hypothetical protein